MAMKPSSKFDKMKLKSKDDLPPQFVTPDRAQKMIDKNKPKPSASMKPRPPQGGSVKDFGGKPGTKLPIESFTRQTVTDARRAALLKGIKRK